MYAVIETGGKQYRVAEGDLLKVEKLPADVGANVAFDRVLLLHAGADEVRVGTPIVAGARVEAEVVRHGRGAKIVVFKFRRRKNYRRKQGHRQAFTELRITGIRGTA